MIDITETEYEDTTVSKVVVDGKFKSPKYHGFQYRAMKTVLMTGGMGAVWFKYDIAPIEVHYTMSYQTWSEFLVHVCAIIGGMFAAAGMLESITRNGLGAIATVFAPSSLQQLQVPKRGSNIDSSGAVGIELTRS